MEISDPSRARRRYRWLFPFLGAVVVVSAWTNEASAQDVAPISQTLVPLGSVAVTVAPRVIFGDFVDDVNRNSGLVSSLLPQVQWGATKNLQVGFLPLGVAYRWDDPFDLRGFEVIPAISVNPDFYHSNITGLKVSVTPQLSLDVRQWINKTGAITLGGGGGSPLSWQEGGSGCPAGYEDLCGQGSSLFDQWFFAGTGGVTQSIGEHFTFAIGATIAYTMGFGTANPSTSVFTIGSRVRHGISTDPLIRFHLNEQFSFDGNISYTRYTAESFGFATASAGINCLF